jgi:predicted  nucleic acid-binding Zn-ribbon protein
MDKENLMKKEIVKAGTEVTAGSFACAECGYVLKTAGPSKLPTCFKCGCQDWEKSVPAAAAPSADKPAAEKKPAEKKPAAKKPAAKKPAAKKPAAKKPAAKKPAAKKPAAKKPGGGSLKEI